MEGLFISVVFIWPIVFYVLVFVVIPYQVMLQRRALGELKRTRELTEQSLEAVREVLDLLKNAPPEDSAKA